MNWCFDTNLREPEGVVPLRQVGVAGDVVAGLLDLVVGIAHEPGDSLCHLGEAFISAWILTLPDLCLSSSYIDLSSLGGADIKSTVIVAHVAVDAAAVAADLEGVDVHSLGGVLLDDPLDAVHAEAVRPVAHPVPDDHGRRRGRGCELHSVDWKRCQSSHFSRTTTPTSNVRKVVA